MMRKLKSEKLQERHPSSSRTNNILDPIEVFTSNTLGRMKRRKKSYTCQTAAHDSSLLVYEAALIVDNSVDYNEGFLADTSVSLNSWYYGKLEVCNSDTQEESKTPRIRRKTGVASLGPLVNSTEPSDNDVVKASMILRIDGDGSFAYSLMATSMADTEQIQIPYEGHLCCLNFKDPDQPRFSSVQRLIAYLISSRRLKKVPFTWLLDNTFW